MKKLVLILTLFSSVVASAMCAAVLRGNDFIEEASIVLPGSDPIKYVDFLEAREPIGPSDNPQSDIATLMKMVSGEADGRSPVWIESNPLKRASRDISYTSTGNFVEKGDYYYSHREVSFWKFIWGRPIVPPESWWDYVTRKHKYIPKFTGSSEVQASELVETYREVLILVRRSENIERPFILAIKPNDWFRHGVRPMNFSIEIGQDISDNWRGFRRRYRDDPRTYMGDRIRYGDVLAVSVFR